MTPSLISKAFFTPGSYFIRSGQSNTSLLRSLRNQPLRWGVLVYSRSEIYV